MKRNDLIETLLKLPEDAEITIVSGDDTLGNYNYNKNLYFSEEEGFETKKGTIYASYSNYADDRNKKVKVWVIS